MLRKVITSIAGLAALVAVTVFAVQAKEARAESFKIGYSVWVGYGPFFIARDKGFFEEEGVEVELVNIEDVKIRFAALASGRIHGLATTVDTLPIYLKPDIQYRYLFAVDDSRGGDGIVAHREIESIADLEGKTIAFNQGSVSQFYLNVLLQREGLSEGDIEAVQMSPGDAGSAFVAGQVDAAVTWEPWLSRGDAAPHGHILADTSTEPGLVTDIFLTTTDVIEERMDDLKALYRAWDRAVDFIESDPDEAYAIMAKGVGGWLKDPAVFAETLEKVAYLDDDANRAFFGTPDQPGRLTETIDHALAIWRDFGRLQVETSAKELIDYRIVRQ